jgi:GMP synthase-like glutamine amidotransferase
VVVAAERRRRSGRGLSTLVLIHQEDAGPGVFAGDFVFEPRSVDHDAVIVLGGDANVDEEDRYPWLADEKRLIAELIDARVPLLGVCLGAQLVAEVAGAAVGPLADGTEVGWPEVVATGEPDPLFDPLPDRFRAFQWHGYGFELPPSATELARGPRGPQAFRLADAPAWGIQFHAEVTAATVRGWIRDYGPAAGIDAAALTAETDREIARWNELGRTLCAAFLEVARSRRPARRGAGPR